MMPGPIERRGSKLQTDARWGIPNERKWSKLHKNMLRREFADKKVQKAAASKKTMSLGAEDCYVC